MGSLGEEELFQIDIHESGDSAISMTSSKPTSLTHQSTYLALQEVLGRYTADEVEIHEKISMYLKNLNTRTIKKTRNQKIKWVVMKLKMDGYEVSLCKTTWDSSFGTFTNCSKESYEFIEVMTTKAEKRLIIDVDFKSQFEVARPTGTYKELINTLPSIFVGSEEKLKMIISLLCPAGKRSLKEKGLHIPPWRRNGYMKSKWFSKSCKRLPFSSSNNSIELGIDDDDDDQSEDKITSSTCCLFIFKP